MAIKTSGQVRRESIRASAADWITMTGHRIYAMPFARVYSAYVAKAERKGRTKAEVDEIIRWLTGLDQARLEGHIAAETDFQTFFAEVPLNPDRTKITGVVCGVRVEDVAEPLMRELRYLDKLIDELARGKAMAKILRA
jgi:hypothetical protein